MAQNHNSSDEFQEPTVKKVLSGMLNENGTPDLFTVEMGEGEVRVVS
jgi:hypothetical protein